MRQKKTDDDDIFAMLASLSEKCHCGRREREIVRGRERQKCHHIRCRRRIRRFGRRKGKTADDAVKTAADKNKWGESRLKKQSEGREGGRAEQLRKNSVLSAVKLFLLRDRLVVKIVKNERS